MLTYSESSAATLKQQERAFHYERLKSAADVLRATIERLETSSAETSVEALNSILTLCADVDPEIATSGSKFILGGLNVREVLKRVAEQALDQHAQRAEKNVLALAKARTALIPVEADLATYS